MIRSKKVRDNTNEIAKTDEPKSNDSILNNFNIGNLTKNLINLTQNSNPIQTLSNIITNLTTNNDEKAFDKIREILKSALGIEMAFCPKGRFIMGSPLKEVGRSYIDNFTNRRVYKMEDQHEVTISKPFLIGKFHVTRGLYKKVIGKLPPEVEEDLQFPSEEDKYSCPITYVDSFDAEEFCEKLNNAFSNYLPLGYTFDLPSEAQWEYACRAGTTTALNNGMNLRDTTIFCPNLAKVGWFGGNSANGLHPVGLKQPNAWGIYDMHGNAHEWCKDYYYFDKYPNGTTDPISVVPKNVVPESYRIIRGGGMTSGPAGCRSAARFPSKGNEKSFNVGFRFALVPIRDFDSDIYQGPDEEPYVEIRHDSKDNRVKLSNNNNPNIKRIS